MFGPVSDASISTRLRVTFIPEKIPHYTEIGVSIKDGSTEFFGTCCHLIKQKKCLTLAKDPISPEEFRKIFMSGDYHQANHPSEWSPADILCVTDLNSGKTIYRKEWTDEEAMVAASQT
jgi:hypothetical protein